MVIFATVLVVVGIALAAYFSSQKFGGEPQPAAKPAPAQPSKPAAPAQPTGPAILLQNADAVTVMRLDGTSERLAMSDFIQRVPDKGWPAEGSSAANGALAYFNPQKNAADKREIYLSPDRRYAAALGTPKSDNATVIQVTQGNEAPQSLVLRDKQGKPLADALILGWLTPRTLAVSAVISGSRWVYAADLDHGVRSLAPLPDNAVYLEARGGEVWYATAQLGEGIESTPKGPSELHRISVDGKDVTVAHDALRVILVAVPDASGDLMYATDDGMAFYLKNGDESSRLALGKRRPLAYLPDGRLLLRDSYNVVSYDPASGEIKKLDALPEGEIKVFVSASLDETPAKP